MKFDPKQPHGLIMNHPWARYEQGGVLFDNQGKPLGGDVEEIDLAEEETFTEPINNSQKDFALNNAQAFLKNILAEGPLTRSSIFREASNNNQNWDVVKTAFAELEGEVFTRRNQIHWKLKTE